MYLPVLARNRVSGRRPRAAAGKARLRSARSTLLRSLDPAGSCTSISRMLTGKVSFHSRALAREAAICWLSTLPNNRSQVNSSR